MWLLGWGGGGGGGQDWTSVVATPRHTTYQSRRTWTFMCAVLVSSFSNDAEDSFENEAEDWSENEAEDWSENEAEDWFQNEAEDWFENDETRTAHIKFRLFL